MTRMIVAAIALAFTTPLPSPAQSLGDDPRVSAALSLLDMWVDAQLAYERIPGISIGVVHDQDLIWSKGYGYSDVDRMTPATPRTIYSICSISKLFTSTGVMQLRDHGHLRLDDPVSKHLPWFNIKETYEGAAPITIEGLLTHSSGLPREADFPYWTEASFPSRESIIDHLSKQETLYPASTYYQYSNLALTMAGEIVAQVSGMPYAEYVQRHILDPLGLDDTSPEIPEKHKGGQLATGYGSIGRDGTRKTVHFYTVNGIAPAAGYASTVQDLAKFASWQFRLLEHGDDDVLARNTLREMQRVHFMDPGWRTTRGIGFSIWRSDDKTFVGHGGSCPGYRTQLLLRPQEQFAAIFMTNAQGVNTGLYTRVAYEVVAPAIAAALSSDEYEAPDSILSTYVGRYERPLGGETEVIVWEGKLAMLSLPTENPLNALTKLKHVGEHTFQRIRRDGELGEEFTFEIGDDGRPVRLWRNNQYQTKVN
ncbi:MAG: serine hydrolase [Gemmatimonadetes bacterium]|nr:serine hydrolase [Gemmatimonadota bacterium]